jgi:hypothetical protein
MEEDYKDIPDYSGYCPDCPKCGATMGFCYYKAEFKCFECEYVMEEDDWDYIIEEDDSEPPFGCAACGGPYPQCKTSCKLFDD